MNEYDTEVAHPGNGINFLKNHRTQADWQLAIERLRTSTAQAAER